MNMYMHFQRYVSIFFPRYLLQKQAVRTLQHNIRVYLMVQRLRRTYEVKQTAAVTLQATWRGHLARQQVRRACAAITLQAAWRGHLARQQVRKVRAAITLQAAWRGYLARQEVTRIRAAVCIQAVYR